MSNNCAKKLIEKLKSVAGNPYLAGSVEVSNVCNEAAEFIENVLKEKEVNDD